MVVLYIKACPDVIPPVHALSHSIHCPTFYIKHNKQIQQNTPLFHFIIFTLTYV